MKTIKLKNRASFLLVISSVISGFIMWVIGGLYHNLIMPSINENIHPHHEGLGITLLAYILLGLFMSYFYLNSKEIEDSLLKGIKIGVIIGILWVFPHGLTMAAVHESSISYQITNTLYHIFEQGIGGIIIFLIFRYIVKMKNLHILLVLIIFVGSCNPSSTKKEEKQNENIMKDSEPKVTGIGGIFFKSENPKEIGEWYGKHLGLAIDDYGSPFEFRNANNPDEINYLRWSPFEEGTDYFQPSKKDFMINYRVQNIEGLVKQLKDKGVTVVDEIAEYEYGKFVHIMDPEGNKIELWEPVDSVFAQMGGETTK